MRHAAWHNPQVSLAGTRGGAGAEMSEFGARFRSLARVLGCCVFSMTLADRCPSFAPPLRGEKWGYVGDIGGMLFGDGLRIIGDVFGDVVLSLFEWK